MQQLSRAALVVRAYPYGCKGCVDVLEPGLAAFDRRAAVAQVDRSLADRLYFRRSTLAFDL
jgi:hypothetical protein